MKVLRVILCLLVIFTLSQCKEKEKDYLLLWGFLFCVNQQQTTTDYSISGSITGLTASGLVLQNNSTDDLTVSSGATSFTFTTRTTGTYSVTVKTQPTGLTCSLTNASGTATADVTDIAISCVEQDYSIGGNITGLTGSGLVLQNNSTDDLTISSGTTSFTFATRTTGTYSVTVKTQPFAQTCSVSNASGTATANVTNITISCVDLATQIQGFRQNRKLTLLQIPYSVSENQHILSPRASCKSL